MNEPLILFDDGQGRWGPLTDCRRLRDWRCGPVALAERHARVLGRRLVDTAAPNVASNRAVYLNERWTGERAEALRASIDALPLGAAIVDASGALLAARTDGTEPQGSSRRSDWPGPSVLMSRPWHLLEASKHLLAQELQVFGVGSQHVDQGATIAEHVVLDTSRGQVYIGQGTRIAPFVVIEGPCFIGDDCLIKPFSHIRAHCIIGPGCTIGGEVKQCLFQGFANKAHAGYLGQAIVGEFVNLGADTNASNLKNTWGPVRVQLDQAAPAEDTGLHKFGPIIGDFVQTAIGTRLPTGACIGTASCLAGSAIAPKHTPPMTFLTDFLIEAYDIDRCVAVARRIVASKGQSWSQQREQALRRLATGRALSPPGGG